MERGRAGFGAEPKAAAQAKRPVELGNHELGAVHAAGLDGIGQLLAIIALAAFDLDVFLDQLPAAAIEEIGDRCALRLDT
jgi:hypothetical protein